MEPVVRIISLGAGWKPTRRFMEKGPFWESDDSKDWRKFCGFTTEHSHTNSQSPMCQCSCGETNCIMLLIVTPAWSINSLR